LKPPPTATSPGTRLYSIPVADLNGGDVVTVNGEAMTVMDIDADTGAVTLQGGDKYGAQTVNADGVLYADAKPTPAAPGAAGGGLRFSMEPKNETPEMRAKKEAFSALVDEAVNTGEPHGVLDYREVNKREVGDVARQGGPDISGMHHEITAKELRHALREHSDLEKEAAHNPPQRILTADDLNRIPDIIDNYDKLTVQKRGKYKSSLVYEKQYADGTNFYVERALESSQKNRPRLVTKTAWAVASAGVEPGTASVYTPRRTKDSNPVSEKSKSTGIRYSIEPVAAPSLGAKEKMLSAVVTRGYP
jgi:hypothetical protein